MIGLTPVENYEDFIQKTYDFQNDSHLISDLVVTEKRIDTNLEKWADVLSFYYSYPDLFVDLITPIDSKFKLYFFQRLILRSYNRFRQVFVTATRGASKSFLGFLSRYLTCMFVPNHLSFVVSDVKEQATNIATQKINQDLWLKFPLLQNEMMPFRDAGGTIRKAVTTGKGYAKYTFTSGSQFDVVGIDTARGLRRHSGIFEEVILLDPIPINESIIPLMNIPRATRLGEINPNEVANSQKIFVTSAGYHYTFAYEKMVETLLKSAVYPESYICITIDFRVPMFHNLISPQIINELRSSPSYQPESFDREYFSHWSGKVKGAAFDYDAIKRTRKLVQADYKNVAKTSEQNYNYGEEFYVVAADMAKDGDASTAVTIVKVRPLQNWYSYLLVNGFEIDTSDYEKVARILKETALHYEAKLLVYDATGIGASLRDWLNKPSKGSGTLEDLPGFGILNPPKDSEKDIIKYHDSNVNICYELKVTGQLASDINQYFFGRLNSGMFKMLISFREAIEKKQKIRSFAFASKEKQQKAMIPYQICDRLEEELLNLDIKEIKDSSSSYLRVTRRKGTIQKDFFSSVEYALFAAHRHFEAPFYKKKIKKSQRLDFGAYFKVTEV